MKTVEERFWAKVNKNGPVPAHMPHLGNCWIWTAGTDRKYGLFYFLGKQEKAHRASFVIAGGKLESGKMVCHHCDNKLCVRPSHLFQGTPLDNLMDCINKGRMPVKTHCAKGHPFEGDNLIVRKKEHGRGCRICRAAAARKFWRKNNNPKLLALG